MRKICKNMCLCFLVTFSLFVVFSFYFSTLHLCHVTFFRMEHEKKEAKTFSWQREKERKKDIKIALTDVFLFSLFWHFFVARVLYYSMLWVAAMVWIRLRVSSAHLDKCFLLPTKPYRFICVIKTHAMARMLSFAASNWKLAEKSRAGIPLREMKYMSTNGAIIEVTFTVSIYFTYIFHHWFRIFSSGFFPILSRTLRPWHHIVAAHTVAAIVCAARMNVWEERKNSNEKFNQGVWFKRIRSNIKHKLCVVGGGDEFICRRGERTIAAWPNENTARKMPCI